MLERGERTPTIKTLLAISGALGVTLAEFFTDVSVPQANIWQRELSLANRLEDLRLSQDEADILLVVARAMFEGKKTPVQLVRS